MARQRDYAAEYRARRAKAQEAGHPGYRAQRAARAAGVEPGGRRQIVRSPAGRVVRTTAGGAGFGVIDSQLRATPDARVKLLVTYTDNAGRTREATIYGKGGRRARDLLDDYGGDWYDGIEGDIDSMYGGGGVAAISQVQAVFY